MTEKAKSTSSRQGRDVRTKLLLQRALLGEVFEQLLAVGFEWPADDHLRLWAYVGSELNQEDRDSLSSVEAELYADEVADRIETRVVVKPDLVPAGVAGQLVFCRRLPR